MKKKPFNAERLFKGVGEVSPVSVLCCTNRQIMGRKPVESLESLSFLLSFSEVNKALVVDFVSLRGINSVYLEVTLSPLLSVLKEVWGEVGIVLLCPELHGWSVTFPLFEGIQMDGAVYYKAAETLRGALPGITGIIVAALTKTRLNRKAKRPVTVKPFPQPGMILPLQFDVTLTEDDRLAFAGEHLIRLFSDEADPLNSLEN